MIGIRKFVIPFLMLVLFSQAVMSLGVSGRELLVRLDFEPGEEYEYNYVITNNDGYTADYVIYADTYAGTIPLAPYFEMTPDSFTGVRAGEKKQFNIKLKLPQELDSPGENEARVWVRGGASGGSTGITARPVVGIRFIIFVLYPWKALQWESFTFPPTNVDETKDFTLTIKNIGEPTIDSAYADIIIYSSDSDQQIRQLRTDTETDILAKESRTLNAGFNTAGLLKGNYYAKATLYWDSNVSEKELDFTIGDKYVALKNYTKLFEIDAINEMDIIVQSEWNTEIKAIVADVNIYDSEKEVKLASFKSFPDSLSRLEEKTLKAYFDTHGFEKGEYVAEIILSYEGMETRQEGMIRIDKDIDAATVDKVPSRFNFPELNMIHVLGTLLLLFILLNLFLIYRWVISGKREKKEDSQPTATPELKVKKEDDIPDEVISHVRELKKKYNDEYIKEMMLKKGWSPSKVEEILKRIRD